MKIKAQIFLYFVIGLVICSCGKWIIPDAIKNNKPLLIEVMPHGDAWTNPKDFYKAEVVKKGEEYEFVVTRSNGVTIYNLPPNKLNLLSQFEGNLKDLTASLKYIEITISSENQKKSFQVNTDIVSDFIGGLKKKY